MTTETHIMNLSWELYGSSFSLSLDVTSEVTNYSVREIEEGLAAGRMMLIDERGDAIAQFNSHYRAERAASRGDFLIEPYGGRVTKLIQATQAK